MTKSILFLTLVCTATIASERTELQPWVQKTSQIAVKTMKIDIEIPITEATTVQNVKEAIQESDGVLVDHQDIYLVQSQWFGLYKENIKLADDANIKFAMNAYNSKNFSLYLSLRALRAHSQ